MKTAVKEILMKIRKLGMKILSFYGTKTLRKLLLTIVVFLLVSGVIYYIPVLSVKKSSITQKEKVALSNVTEGIAQDSGEILVAENGGRQLYIDTENCILKVKDTSKRLIWSSAVSGASSASELALLNVTYIGEDNLSYKWDSYTYSTAMKSYTLGKITDGVQLTMEFSQGDSSVFYEYMPKKMSVDRFENFFVAGIAQLKDAGTITQDQYDRYLTTLKLVYKKSIKDECYAVTYTGTPPASAVTQMIEVAQLLNYTSDMLVSDSAEFGLTVTFQEPAQFTITVEATLVDGELEVRVPTYEIQNNNDFYAIQNIEVLPNFGAVTNKQSVDGGYMLVPDGSGALIELNSYTPDVTEYNRPVYDNDYFSDYYYAPEYSDELTMPIFGMTYGKDEASTHGFLAIIEEGAETAYIQTKLANNSEDGPTYNKIYSTFDSVQYKDVNVNGAYSEDNIYYRVATEEMDIDYTIKYLLFSEPVTYYDMARAYQDELVATNELIEAPSYQEGGKLYLEVLGGLTMSQRILGIPYDYIESMTSYQQLEEILKDLQGTNLAVSYTGVFNKGLNNELNNEAQLVKENGSKAEYEELMSYAKEQGVDLYLGVNFSRVYKDGNGFLDSSHAVKDYSDTIAPFYRYNLALGLLSGYITGVTDYNYYYLVSPQYLSGVVDGFLKDGEAYDSLYLSDLAGMYYADYDNENMVDAYEAESVLQSNLLKLNESKKLSLSNPWMKNIGYGEIATDISRTSSEYKSFATTIPFRQLVMNGLIPYTTENVNMSSNQLEYYILQAVELGAYPKFTISGENSDILKTSDYSYYYSIQYDQLKDRIKEVYQACDSAWSEIGTNEITNHTRLADQVFQTEYATGVSAIVNYNLYDVTLEDGTKIPALSYLIQ